MRDLKIQSDGQVIKENLGSRHQYQPPGPNKLQLRLLLKERGDQMSYYSLSLKNLRIWGKDGQCNSRTDYQASLGTQTGGREVLKHAQESERTSYNLMNLQHFPSFFYNSARLVNQRKLSALCFSVLAQCLTETSTLWTRWRSMAQIITKIDVNYDSMSSQTPSAPGLCLQPCPVHWVDNQVYSHLAFPCPWWLGGVANKSNGRVKIQRLDLTMKYFIEINVKHYTYII